MKTSLSRAFLVLVSALLLLSGCKMVTSKYPLPSGNNPELTKQFEGEWLGGDETFCIEFGMGMTGRLLLLDANGRKKDQLMEITVTPWETGGLVSALQTENNRRQDEYYLARYKFVDKDMLVFWHLKDEVFVDAISKQLLSVEEARPYMITTPPQQLLEFIKANDAKELFDYRNPNVMRKTGNSCRYIRDNQGK